MNKTMNTLFPACLGLALSALTTHAADRLDRTVLPVQLPKPPLLKELYAKDVKAIPPRQEVGDRVFERMIGSHVGRPDLMGARTSITVADGMAGMMESTFINVKNKSKTITAEIQVPEKGAHGIILAQAGRFGGWALYARDGVPAYDYNWLGLQQTSIAATTPLTVGKHTVRFEFAYDGGGPGKGGLGTLFVNGTNVAEGRIEHTQGGIFSADETTDVGIDLGTPVVEAIGADAKSRFTGRIPKVTVEVK
jgi:arylsulfatase